jgi:predicted transcriptional regulator
MADATPHGDGSALVRLCAEIVSAFVSNNPTAPAALPTLIGDVHRALGSLAGPGATAPQPRQKPAVPVKASVQHEFLVCLEDGKKLKMLKRYLRARYGMSPDDYRKRWGLTPEYPMVAPAYAARRSEFAKSIGLGRGRRRTA